MATRNHTEDQRTDTLLYHLAVLTQSVTLAIAHLETLMQAPISQARERRMAAILHALDRVNETAMQHCLGKSVQGLAHEKQQVEGRVAQQYQDKPSCPRGGPPCTEA
jgi:hypothetical protein